MIGLAMSWPFKAFACFQSTRDLENDPEAAATTAEARAVVGKAYSTAAKTTTQADARVAEAEARAAEAEARAAEAEARAAEAEARAAEAEARAADAEARAGDAEARAGDAEARAAEAEARAIDSEAMAAEADAKAVGVEDSRLEILEARVEAAESRAFEAESKALFAMDSLYPLLEGMPALFADIKSCMVNRPLGENVAAGSGGACVQFGRTRIPTIRLLRLSNTPSLYTQELAQMVFGNDTLGRCCLKGSLSGGGKTALDKETVDDIIVHVLEKFSNVTESDVRSYLRRKCNNAATALKKSGSAATQAPASIAE
ncbi:uncharacterized protein LOC144166043 [Haemaphysalis longicornis]